MMQFEDLAILSLILVITLAVIGAMCMLAIWLFRTYLNHATRQKKPEPKDELDEILGL